MALSKALDKEVEHGKDLKKYFNKLQSDASKLVLDNSCAYKALKSKADLASVKVEKAVCEKQLRVIEKKS